MLPPNLVMSLLCAMVLLALGACKMVADDITGPTPNVPSTPLPQIPTTFELVSDNVGDNISHGWQTCRLVKYHGTLYASGSLPIPPNGDDDFWEHPGVFYRRQHDGTWVETGTLSRQAYTMFVAPDGRFWAVAPSSYEDCEIYRMNSPLDFFSFRQLHNGTTTKMGASISPEGNFLAMYGTYSHFDAFNPNAVTCAFYEQATDKWYTSRLETPEGLYGYEGIIVRGRQAIAVMQSAISDPKANPTPPHYSWRHVRLARCDDLTVGKWRNVAWLMPEYGFTTLEDLVVGRDGCTYLSYLHRSGSTLEQANSKPLAHYITRIHDDLTIQTFATGIETESTRLLVDGKGGWYGVGRPATNQPLHLWSLDPETFTPVKEYVLPGTEKLTGGVIHTLRPERFGGESDGDRIHLLTAEYMPYRADKTREVRLWHAYFDLPLQ